MERDDFCGQGGVDANGDQIKRTIFEINNAQGKKVSAFSPFPEEAEVLFQPLRFFRVIGVKIGDHAQGRPYHPTPYRRFHQMLWCSPINVMAFPINVMAFPINGMMPGLAPPPGHGNAW